MSGSGMSTTTKVVLGATAVAAVGVGIYFMMGSSEEAPVVGDTPKKPAPAAEKAAVEADTPVANTHDEAASAPAPTSASAAAAAEGSSEEDNDSQAAGAGSGASNNNAGPDAAAVAACNVSKAQLLELMETLYNKAKAVMDELDAAVDAGQLPVAQYSMIAGMQLQALDQAVNEEFGLSQDDVLQAQEVYAKDADVEQKSADLRQLINGNIAKHAPEPTIALDEFCLLVKKNAHETVKLLKELKDEIIASGKSGDAAKEEFQRQFMEKMGQMQMQAVAACGISAEDFQTNMTAYATEEAVVQAMQEAQQEIGAQQDEIIGDGW